LTLRKKTSLKGWRADIVANSLVAAATPTTVNSSVRNARKYLTLAEVERLIAEARKSDRYIATPP